jgi:hypothetical protein
VLIVVRIVGSELATCHGVALAKTEAISTAEPELIPCGRNRFVKDHELAEWRTSRQRAKSSALGTTTKNNEEL